MLQSDEKLHRALLNPSADDIRSALRLEMWTIGIMLVVVSGSFWLAATYGRLLSVSLFAYSLIELMAAFALYRRLAIEEKSRSQDDAVWNKRERQAERFSGFMLYGLIICVALHAIYSFTQAHHADVPTIAIVLAYFASIGLPYLAKAKHEMAIRIGSRALRVNAVASFSYGYLSLMILAGLSATVIHDWWLDTLGALMILPMLIREARGAIRENAAKTSMEFVDNRR